MSYLNRTNGYAPTGNPNSEPSPKRIVVKRIFRQWVGSCPVCPVEKGFMAHSVWDLVRAWAMSHADKHRKETMADVRQYIEKVDRD